MTSPTIAGAHVLALVDKLSESLARSVVIDDPAVRLICASRHFGDEDSVRIRAMLDRDAGDEIARFVLGQGAARWHGPHVLEASAELGLKSRLCVPLHGPGMLIGLLMVIDADQSLTPTEIDRIVKVSRDIAQQMHADSLASDPEQVERRIALRNLLSDDDSGRQSAIAFFGRSRTLPASVSLVVTIVAPIASTDLETPVEIALNIAVDTVIRLVSKGAWVYVTDERAVLLQVRSVPISNTELAQQAERIRTELARLLGDSALRTRIGIGTSTGNLNNAPVARQRAEVAVKAAQRLQSASDSVVFWEDLGVDALLLSLPGTMLVRESLPRALRALMEADDTGKLVETLRRFLDCGGSISRTAAAMHMHRTSLYYRLEQIRSACGIDLESGEDRLLMHMGLHLLDVIGLD